MNKNFTSYGRSNVLSGLGRVRTAFEIDKINAPTVHLVPLLSRWVAEKSVIRSSSATISDTDVTVVSKVT